MDNAGLRNGFRGVPALIRVLVVASVTLMCALAVLAAPLIVAEAHGAVTFSSPSAGSQVARPVSEVRLVFSTSIKTSSAVVTLAVDGADPRPLTTEVDRRSLIAAIPADVLAESGQARTSQRWTIGYRVMGEDGHQVDDELAFTVSNTPLAPSTAAPSTPNAAQPTPSTSTGAPERSSTPESPHREGPNPHEEVSPQRWLLQVLVAGVVVLAAFLAFVGPRLGRRAPTTGTPPHDTDDASETTGAG